VTVAFVAAMPEEIAPLCARLTGATRRQDGKVELHQGRLGDRHVVVAATGDGANHARIGVNVVVARTVPTALVVLGVSGALSPELGATDLVVASRVMDEDGAARAADAERVALAARATGGRPAVVLSARRIVDSADEKRRLAQQVTGSAVVDLESAAYVAHAERHSLPWLVLRAVSDRADENLPAILNRSVDADGAVNRNRVLRGLFGDPGALPRLISLRMRVAQCAEVLARAAEAALPAFPLPPPRGGA
jgi:adenosylhomocysteine nucleosidase